MQSTWNNFFIPREFFIPRASLYLNPTFRTTWRDLRFLIGWSKSKDLSDLYPLTANRSHRTFQTIHTPSTPDPTTRTPYSSTRWRVAQDLIAADVDLYPHRPTRGWSRRPSSPGQPRPLVFLNHGRWAYWAVTRPREKISRASVAWRACIVSVHIVHSRGVCHVICGSQLTWPDRRLVAEGTPRPMRRIWRCRRAPRRGARIRA